MLSELFGVGGGFIIVLGELRARLAEVPRDRPVVAACRSGARSAQATVILEKAGCVGAGNLTGGLLAWHALGLPTA